MTVPMLNVADFRLRSRVNGPGVRSVVWVQGCTIGCPGCFNPHTHAHRIIRLAHPRELAEQLLGVPDTDGITISGGEPFEQAHACAIHAETVRNAGRSVVVFSGRRFDALMEAEDRDVHRFLRAIDLLVAGPYVASLNGDGSSWRGSTNQTIHFLTDRLKGHQASTGSRPVVEITTDGRSISSTGFPEDQDLAFLAAVARVACGAQSLESLSREQT